MANDAYQLQGLNGVDGIGVSQTFTGRSRGFLVGETSDVTFDVLKPDGTALSLSLTGLPTGYFQGGIITSVSGTTGTVFVFPLDADYTIA